MIYTWGSLICVALGFLISIAVIIRNNSKYKIKLEGIDVFNSSAIGILVGFIFFMSTSITSMVLTDTAEIKYTYSESNTQNIIALSDNISTSGSFFLGTGNVNGELKVCYATKDKNGAVQIKTMRLDSSNVFIIEDGQKVLKVKEANFANKTISYLFGKPVMIGYKYEFHIPEGSITTDIKIDLN